MQDQLVRQLENGQELSNNLKLIVVAITSFTIGVVATNYFNQSGITDPVLTPRQKELQAIAIEAEKRPFFSVEAPVGKTDHQEQ